MAEKFYTLLTEIGKAKIANSAGFGSKVNFVKMKVGDGGGSYYNPTEGQEDLVNTVYEGNINHITIDEENPNWINVEMMIPANVGGFMIREYGIFDEENNMLGVAKCPETYKPVAADGSTKELLMRMNLEVSNTQNVTLKIDPTIIFAKKSDLELLENKIENLKVISAEDFLDESVTIEGEMHPLLKEEFEKVESKMADMEKDIENIDLSAEKVNLDSTKLKSKTVKEGMEELFQYADNGKKLISTSINNKGVSTSPTDTFPLLADKIEKINTSSIKSIQRGIRPSGEDNYDYRKVTFKINQVDMNNSVIVVQPIGGHYSSCQLAKFIDNSTISLETYKDFRSKIGNCYWSVIEFKNIKNIQRGHQSCSYEGPRAYTIQINSVDMGKSLVFLTFTSYGEEDVHGVSAFLKTNEELRIEAQNGRFYEFNWCVVEF